jgi:hypothetical protein
VGHEFDRKDVGMMPGGNTGIEGKGIGKAGRIVFPDIEIGVVGA